MRKREARTCAALLRGERRSLRTSEEAGRSWQAEVPEVPGVHCREL